METMKIISHKVNTTKDLVKTEKINGIEVDIRCYKNELVLSHDPLQDGEIYFDYLENYDHNLLVLNIKESGIEDLVIKRTKEKLVNKKFFLLDVEIPFIVTNRGVNKENLSVRYSEYESFESLTAFNLLADWIWIDTFNKLPKLNKHIIKYFNTKKTCLVSPSRWGREDDLDGYLEIFKKYDYSPDYIMK